MCVCVCVRERMRAKQIGALVYSIGDGVIQTCGLCNPRRGQRTRSSSTTGSSEGGDPLHCPLYPPPFLPLGRHNSCSLHRAPALNGRTVALVRGASGRSGVCKECVYCGAEPPRSSTADAAPLQQLPGRSASASGN